MHQVESPCIDSIVFDTPWKRRSNVASSAALELRAPWPLAAPEPAAIFPPVLTDDDRCLLAPDAEGAKANGSSKHAPISLPFQNKLFFAFQVAANPAQFPQNKANCFTAEL